VVLDGLFVGNQEEELCFVEIQPTTQDVMAYGQLLAKAVQTVHRSRFSDSRFALFPSRE
jgi:hypothetical protein